MTSRPNRALIDISGRASWAHFIDTLATEGRRLTQTNDLPKAGALTLEASGSCYRLPGYLGHNALIDAWATAELLLAQIKKGATLSPLWSG